MAAGRQSVLICTLGCGCRELSCQVLLWHSLSPACLSCRYVTSRLCLSLSALQCRYLMSVLCLGDLFLGCAAVMRSVVHLCYSEEICSVRSCSTTSCDNGSPGANGCSPHMEGAGLSPPAPFCMAGGVALAGDAPPRLALSPAPPLAPRSRSAPVRHAGPLISRTG